MCSTHQSMARAEAAAALQPLSRTSPLPSVAFLPTAVPRVLAHTLLALAPRGLCPSPLCPLSFSTHLVQPLVTCAVPLLGVAGGDPTAGHCGALVGTHSSTPWCCPGCSMSLLCHRSAAPPAWLQLTAWHRTSTATSKHGSVPPGLLSAHAAPSVPQSKPLTPGWARGCWCGDRRCPRHSGLEDKQSPCSPWLPPVLTWKEKLLYAAEELLIHPPWLCIPT